MYVTWPPRSNRGDAHYHHNGLATVGQELCAKIKFIWYYFVTSRIKACNLTILGHCIRKKSKNKSNWNAPNKCCLPLRIANCISREWPIALLNIKFNIKEISYTSFDLLTYSNRTYTLRSACRSAEEQMNNPQKRFLVKNKLDIEKMSLPVSITSPSINVMIELI